MRITNVLTKDSIKIFLKGKGKESVLRELVDLALGDNRGAEREEIVADLCAREKNNNTGIGGGIAIPHSYSDQQKLLAAVGLMKEPMEFNALDAKPVKLIILVLGSKQHPSQKIRLLARISRLLKDEKLKKKLMECRDAGQIYDAFREYENKHFG